MSKCPDCNGTGVDHEKTAQYKRDNPPGFRSGYIRCWSCQGNGLNSLENIDWSLPDNPSRDIIESQPTKQDIPK